MPSTRLVIGAAVSSLLIAGCGGGAAEEEAEATDDRQEETQDSQDDALDVSVSAAFGPYAEDAEAVTYDEEAVPEGAEVEVSVTGEDGGSEYSLSVSGLEANREFGSHLHTEPCGEDPADSGPHYQNEADPEADAENPSTDPAYANPENEVWLDFATDENGNAEQEAEVDWVPREGEANSVVLHEEHTSEEEGAAGAAGDRLACVNVAL
ncbi:Cu-Zn family superoxide dismutase [Lipingzhangella halophila]|uniref:Cu-Zn family superoxide dismutase n=1 Tax=Lipingzhangella halophila TaxID=1783352 RepID=A0A7W7RLK5_9ACTN|nr:superoxide dismutase family protein [Lipingzhangella halophila]MBB4934209.1 Cu-Zn family superoxide dismutase [Lipingzhangella halophila]